MSAPPPHKSSPPCSTARLMGQECGHVVVNSQRDQDHILRQHQALKSLPFQLDPRQTLHRFLETQSRLADEQRCRHKHRKGRPMYSLLQVISQTMKGFFPPNSNDIVASRSPAICATFLPASVDPVKLITSTLQSAASAAPATSPRPCITFNTPSGMPASLANSAISCEIRGAFSEAYKTTVFPHINAGKIFQATLAIGVFAGTIRPATPRACLTV